MSRRAANEQTDPSEAETRDYIARKLNVAQTVLLTQVRSGTYKPDGRQRKTLVALLAFSLIAKSPHGWEYWPTPRGVWVLDRIQSGKA